MLNYFMLFLIVMINIIIISPRHDYRWGLYKLSFHATVCLRMAPIRPREGTGMSPGEAFLDSMTRSQVPWPVSFPENLENGGEMILLGVP